MPKELKKHTPGPAAMSYVFDDVGIISRHVCEPPGTLPCECVPMAFAVLRGNPVWRPPLLGSMSICRGVLQVCQWPAVSCSKICEGLPLPSDKDAWMGTVDMLMKRTLC